MILHLNLLKMFRNETRNIVIASETLTTEWLKLIRKVKITYKMWAGSVDGHKLCIASTTTPYTYNLQPQSMTH